MYRVGQSLVQRRLTSPVLLSTRYASTTAPRVRDPDPQIGDYPNLPWINAQTRAPKGWDDQQDRRNFGEKVHEEEEILSVWSPDLHSYNPYKALAQFIAAAGIIAGFAYVVKASTGPAPFVRRTYPYEGLKQELGERDEDVNSRVARTEEPETE